ncbi:MAG: alpha/beta hydrolase [Lachnospiraceae bacterium]|nr:alpha/beta hydrolase [Lachnospiraceae bacterium]
MPFETITESDFKEYRQEHFVFEGKKAILVKPNGKPNGKWALKTEYFGAFPTLEMELLDRGWHIAYNENDNRWAQQPDLERKGRFIDHVASGFELEKKCAVVGMSCGGLYGVMLAALCPEKISALYLDAPVLNLLSCPAALGAAEISLFEEYHRITGRTVSQLLSYREHPIDKMDILLQNRIPVVLAAGDSDKVVPYCENGQILAEFYRKNGGTIEVYIKENCDHHPHGLKDPAPIADFLERFSHC